MAIFGGRKNLVQRIQQQKWRTDDERKELLAELRESDPRANDLMPILFHADASVRQAVAELFVKCATPQAVMALARDMGNRASNERTMVGRVFNRLPGELMSPVVDSLLGNDKQPKMVRIGWEVALSLGGQVGVKYLRKAVLEAPQAMRGAALRRLLQLARPDQVVDVLLQAAVSEDSRLSATAIEAIAQVNDPRVMDLMLDRFANGDAAVRDQAVKWLLEAAKHHGPSVREHMLRLLGEGEDAIRRLCVEIMLETGEPVEVLTTILEFLHGLLGWLRGQIIDTLKSFGDRMFRPAVHLLQHEDEDIRSTALQVAESFQDPRLVGPLCRMLQDEDWWLKVTAADSLGQLGDARAVPFLTTALEDDDCCWAAVDALAQIGSDEALNPLAQLLKHDRPELRTEVIRSFARFTDDRLLKLLQVVKNQDPSTEVRTLAAEVLRDMAARMNVKIDNTEAGTIAVSADSLEDPADRLLARMREIGASDLHLSVDEPPLVRLGGRLQRMEGQETLTAADSERLIRSVLTERQEGHLDETGELDFCYSIPSVGRYRANAYVQRLGMAATFRAIPNMPPTFDDIRLPGHLTELLNYHQGIIVVSGPAGSGKSTTLAAIVNLINETKPVHVLTLEEPIEFVHPVKTALVNQREIGKHSDSFQRALRGALREDPDVIMVGELRDSETISMALEAAETGHLVITTLHTTNAIQTVDRLITSFPPEEQQQVRMSLSESLKYVVCQQLMPTKDHDGRVAVFEILKGTFSVGNLIRDDKTYQLPSLMQIQRNVGMQTVDMALMELVESQIISPEQAYLRAQNQDLFAPLCPASFIEEQTNFAEAQG
ncbi:MAG: PilT/PilU family type 4a pilus ATPase [Myxococcales bacterium]|nr:PilT/PilU family type 4a pilus ATPase [Myxococcales bacterium]